MPIPFRTMLGMWLRRIPVGRMREAYAQVERHQLPISLARLEQHYLDGGNFEAVVHAAVSAPRENFEANIEKLFSADLRGLDLTDFIARGFVSESEEKYIRMRADAQHDAGAAREYRDYLRENLAKLDREAERDATADVPEQYRAQATEAIPKKRAELADRIAELEAKFPEIREQ